MRCLLRPGPTLALTEARACGLFGSETDLKKRLGEFCFAPKADHVAVITVLCITQDVSARLVPPLPDAKVQCGPISPCMVSANVPAHPHLRLRTGTLRSNRRRLSLPLKKQDTIAQLY